MTCSATSKRLKSFVFKLSKYQVSMFKIYLITYASPKTFEFICFALQIVKLFTLKARSV